jgi:hypothetical protein
VGGCSPPTSTGLGLNDQGVEQLDEDHHDGVRRDT